MLIPLFMVLGLSCCGGEPEQAAIYCYRTLARPDCHAAPLAGERHRLIGYYGPSPDRVSGLAAPPAEPDYEFPHQ